MKKKIPAFMIATLMLISMVSCEQEENTNNISTDTADISSNPEVSEDTVDVETVDPRKLDDLPEKMDFGGMTLGVVCTGKDGGGFDSLVGSEDTSASVMEQAKYERYLYLYDRLGIDIYETSFHYNDMAKKTKALVMANDETVDLVNWGMWRVFMFGFDGCLLPASQVPNIDQSKAYWAEDVRNYMTLLGQQYVLAGDFDTTRYAGSSCILFNKAILENHNQISPYELVKNNQWTFDSLLSMATEVHNDADGDGTPTPGDTIGIVGNMGIYFQNFHTAAGLHQIISDENGYPVFNVPGNEKFVDVWNWCRNVYDSGIMMDVDVEFKHFAENQALFWFTNFDSVANLREMESDFGVVPMPKWDENQDRYYTPSGSNAFGVLITTESAEAVGAYLEIGSSYGHRNLIPLFYDNDLKSKLARDQECAEMYDLILASSSYDLGINAYQEVCNQELRIGFREGKEFASLVEQIKPKINSTLEQAVNTIKESLQ